MSAKLWSILEAAGLQADSLEAALFEVRDNFWLTTAAGVQLDTLGRIFGVLRAGKADTEYRAEIVARAAAMFSGTPEDIIQAAGVFLGASPGASSYLPVYPAGFTLITDASVTKAILEGLAPAGVEAFLGDYIVDETGDPITDAVANQLVSVS